MKDNIIKVDELDVEETKSSHTQMNFSPNLLKVIDKQSFIGSDQSPSSSIVNMSLSNSVFSP